jgi:hypothetical protein
MRQLELESHGRICGHRPVVCDLGCRSIVKAGVLSQHKASCNHRLVGCSNDGCPERIKTVELVGHLSGGGCALGCTLCRWLTGLRVAHDGRGVFALFSALRAAGVRCRSALLH